jgi:hypothetical protein
VSAPGSVADDVEVVHRLAAPAHAASFGHALRRRVLAELRHRSFDGGKNMPEERSPLDLGLRLGERGEHLLLGLLAKTGQLTQPPLFRGRPQILRRCDAELGPQLARRLRPEAGNVHYLDEAGGEAIADLRECGQVAGLGVLDDLVLDRRADAGELRRLAFQGELSNGNGRFADPCGRLAVGSQPERVGPVELE